MMGRWKTLGIAIALGMMALATPQAHAEKATAVTVPSAGLAPGVTRRDATAAQKWLEQTHASLDGDISRIADSFETDLENDMVQVETKLFHAEKLAVDLILAAETAGYDDWSRSLFQNKIRTKLRTIFRLRQITQAATMERLDKYLPGEPGVERRYDSLTGMTEYQPLFRSGTPKPGQPVKTPARALYEMVRGFLDTGNKFSDIKPLTKGALRGMGETADLIWAQDAVHQKGAPNNVRMQTYVAPDRKGVKHPVVAMGPKKAREFLKRVESGALDLDSPEAEKYVPMIPGAGTFQIMRAPDGLHYALVPVTNKTGNFKAGVATIYAFQQALEDVDVNSDAIIEHTSEVGRPEILKLLLKAEVARGALTKTAADSYLEQHTELAARPLKRPVAFDRIRKVIDTQTFERDSALRTERLRARSVAKLRARDTAATRNPAAVRVGGGVPKLGAPKGRGGR